MAVKGPTPAQMRTIAEDLGMSLTDGEVQFFIDQMAGMVGAYSALDALPDYLPDSKYPRSPGYRPGPDENPLNAWYWKATVKGAKRGPLAGKKVVLKDNVCLAGVPMMNGASTLEGFVPNIDATIVTRILDAGGEIVGKATCEHFCLSGGSHTSDPAAVENARKPGYSAGGSSSGSATLIVTGEADLAIGGDQGGSIRIPSAYSGTYGMKGTHGLVPYTGVMPIESTIDHTGPITGNVSDNALFLEVLAGPDGLDPRQINVKTNKYTRALGKGVKGMKIGVLKEGFGHANSEPDVDASVRAAADRFRSLGAEVSEVSVPMHLMGQAIWTPIALEGLQWQMMRGNGLGMNWKGLYATGLLDYHANWRERADELSLSLKISMLVGEYFTKHYRGHFYAKCQNLGRQLTAEYDKVLGEVDLLLMPTLPIKATPLPGPDAPPEDILARAFEMLPNTSPYDVTGHPAMSIPCGMNDGRPIGLQLVGKYWDEATIYQAAHAFEQSGDWMTM
ncbi:MAG: Asp-tRNA(Asn)/Glu-tRNA(Gln) amidotransferase GatCAB subunit A [Rhodospirillaceae bacterium]|nr:Asp-tRNA(Asn)/Glu-tRNA(Gln) amidotransferase GatCAB subunit A [Rhodospirillaceae bacterium]|tara:strand:+ start:333 stop:1847 length:1515 start_codon:yes stop_codon:yes gene_type:complete